MASDPSEVQAAAADPDVSPEELVDGFKKDELVAAAEDAGVEVKSGDTKADLAEKLVVTLTPADEPLFGGAPESRATAQAVAASQAAARALTAEQASHHVVDAIDHYDSYWSRDPGRAHGPYS